MIIQVPVKLVQGGLAKLLADGLRKTADAGANGLLGAVYAALFTAPATFTLTNDIGALVEPVFGGYARQPLTWNANGIDPTGRPEVTSQSVLFKPTDSTASSRCLGAAIVSAVNAGTLYGLGFFNQQPTLGTPNDQCNLTMQVAMPIDATDWGLGSAIN